MTSSTSEVGIYGGVFLMDAGLCPVMLMQVEVLANLCAGFRV